MPTPVRKIADVDLAPLEPLGELDDRGALGERKLAHRGRGDRLPSEAAHELGDLCGAAALEADDTQPGERTRRAH